MDSAAGPESGWAEAAARGRREWVGGGEMVKEVAVMSDKGASLECSVSVRGEKRPSKGESRAAPTEVEVEVDDEEGVGRPLDDTTADDDDAVDVNVDAVVVGGVGVGGMGEVEEMFEGTLGEE